MGKKNSVKSKEKNTSRPKQNMQDQQRKASFSEETTVPQSEHTTYKYFFLFLLAAPTLGVATVN